MDIHIRRMHSSDIGLGMRLKDLAGWNQCQLDWEALLEIESRGCLVAEVSGRRVATATALNYEKRFGWIGMVLVDPDFRRRGVATALVESAIEYLESLSCHCQKLDATDAGATVYGRMGFTVEHPVERWCREAHTTLIEEDGSSLAALSAQHLGAVAELDRSAFGASRDPLLRWYASNGCPAFLAASESGPQGYIMGRVGSSAQHMGPLVAGDDKVAEILVRRFLAATGRKPVIADVVGHNQAAVRLLHQSGFQRKRVLRRMYRGENNWPGQPLETYCLAGFEYG